jgi:hypothetical protein
LISVLAGVKTWTKGRADMCMYNFWKNRRKKYPKIYGRMQYFLVGSNSTGSLDGGGGYSRVTWIWRLTVVRKMPF